LARLKNLEATAVRQDRPIPAHKTVQTTQVTDEFTTGPEVKVVGVTQDDLRANLV